MKESDIVKKIMKYLKNQSECFCWKEHGGMYGTAGIPDIICCFRGKFVAFEVKTENGKTTDLQESTIRKIQKCSGKVAVVRSVEEVKKVIAEVNKSENSGKF